ncbi:MAG TPA: IS66 family insertion sequence element accessory protein TnpB [Stellaceae bacterium]|nr:IS66 family insertion sequence element accessory protein TnpB [Stellaceae bacterium]
MIPVPSGVRVWLAVGRTDMRKGMNGLALQVQEALGRDPHTGDLYVFRGAKGDLIKIGNRKPPITGRLGDFEGSGERAAFRVEDQVMPVIAGWSEGVLNRRWVWLRRARPDQ